jgi:ectoine hydroxylase-related dioxygenase (phytanoyl-CoA dioxygenase family)
MRRIYRDQGYYIEKASDATTIAAVRDARERALELATDSSTFQKRNWTLKDGSFKHHMNPHLSEPAFQRLVNSPGIAKCIRGILGNTPAYITHSKISYKFAGKRHYWYPHQDAGYKAKLRKGFAMAVFLEDCRADNGALEFYPESHKLGLIGHKRKENRHENMHQAVLDATIDITPKFIEGEVGTIVCFDLLMVHSSRENKTGGCRPIFIFEVEPFLFSPTADTGESGFIVNGAAIAPFLIFLGTRLSRLKKLAGSYRSQ